MRALRLQPSVSPVTLTLTPTPTLTLALTLTLIPTLTGQQLEHISYSAADSYRPALEAAMAKVEEDTIVGSVASLWRVIAGPLYPPTPKRCYQRLDPAKVEEALAPLASYHPPLPPPQGG